jgi:sensor histidine kinase regulating citrate/malate metabolism
MNTKVLILGTVVAVFSFSALAGTGAALLKASATSNINSQADTTVTTIAYVASTATPISPRAQANQVKIVKGVANDKNPALECRNAMVASPRAVAACAQSVTMPGCMKLASVK